MTESLLTPETLSKQTYLAPQKREGIKQSIQSLEWALRGVSMYGGMDMPRDIVFPGIAPPEPEILRDSLEKDQALLQSSTPPELSGVEKNHLYRRLKDLDAVITHDMPTYDMMEIPTMSNVEHHMAWEKLHKKHILERRNILRILDSENDSPFFTSVEQLRTSTPPKGDPRRFFQNFDYMQFQEAKDEELAVVDDESYGRFLELKCAGWAEMTICKQLNWPKETYNAAMTRWRKAITDGSYTKFLELQAAGRPASEIREFLGWSQDFYEDAMGRWQASIGTPPQGETPTTAQPATVSYKMDEPLTPSPPAPATLQVPDTPWFAPKVEQETVKAKSAEAGQYLLERMQRLDVRVYDIAKTLQVHHLTLGRKLHGKGSATLTPEDVAALTTTLDQIERERGYAPPAHPPLGGNPASAGAALQGVA